MSLREEAMKRKEELEVRLDLEAQMRSLQRKKTLEKRKKAEENVRVRRNVFRQIMLSSGHKADKSICTDIISINILPCNRAINRRVSKGTKDDTWGYNE